MTSVLMLIAPITCFCMPKVWPSLAAHLMQCAACLGDERTLIRLLKWGVEPDTRDRMILKQTPLMWAALEGEVRIIELLLNAGADINARTEHGQTALMNAAEFGHTACIAFLLDHGAEIDAIESAFGHSALFKAAQMGHRETVQLLVERGANTQVRMRGSITAAQWARGLAESSALFANAKIACAEYLEGVEPNAQR